MKKSIVAFGILSLLFCGTAYAFPIVYYAGTSHYYQAFNGKFDWDDAELNAENIGGYLVTLTSAAEDSWVWANVVPSGNPSWYLLGGYQPQGSQEAAGGWQWVNGEGSFVSPNYNNWNGGEPNDSNGFEDVLQYWNNGQWNDLNRDSDNSAYGGTTYYKGYIVEFDHNPIPEPLSLSLLGMGLLGLIRLRKKKE